jgi:uncharacterized protein
MLPAPLRVSVESARRFHRRAVLLDVPAHSTAAALEYHGFVQIDPVNVCGRMHDLILRNRVVGYREGDLMRHLHGDERMLGAEERVAFEHHLPSTAILAAFPLAAWPFLLAAMRARTRRAGPWSGRLTPREKTFATLILAEIAARGPLSSEDFQDERKARRVWGQATLAKATLQKLFFHGRLLIARRKKNRRVYDLPERVLPATVLAAKEPATDEIARWLVLTKLRQRRLAILKRAELPLVEDSVQPVSVEGCPTLYCLRHDVSLFEPAPGSNNDSVGDLRLLAPLDPLIYDRVLTRRLWDFNYTWEAYTPAAKRVRGHYALPILAGTQLVGHVDPKAERTAGKLRVVSRSVRRGFQTTPAVKALSDFLGLRA